MSDDEVVEPLLDDTTENFDDADEDFCHNTTLTILLEMLETQTKALIYKARPSPTPWLHSLLKQLKAVQVAMFLARVRSAPAIADDSIAASEDDDDNVGNEVNDNEAVEANEAGEPVARLNLWEAAHILRQMYARHHDWQTPH